MLARALPLLLLVSLSSARSVIEAEVFHPDTPAEPSAPQQSGGSEAWNAFTDWVSPVTKYFQRLPEKTPSEVLEDVGDAASDLGETIMSHPVVESVNNQVIQPAGDWVQDTASSLSRRTIGDLYDSAATRVQSGVERADAAVADWIRGDDEEQPRTLH